MEKIILLMLYTLLIYSCDPSTCYKYQIRNKTDKDIELIKFSKDSIGIVTNIFAKDIYTEADECSLGEGGIIHYFEDSIQVRANGLLVKTYYPNDKGKSIFKTNNDNYWKPIIYKGNYEEYVFEITEEDLK